MPKVGNWIRIDKSVVNLLPRDRAYTTIEALISLTIDINNQKENTINGYAKLWRWSRTRARNFVHRLRTGKGHIVNKKGTSKGHEIRLIDKNLQIVEDKLGTHKRQVRDRKQDTTINTNTKTNTKKKPEATLGFLDTYKGKVPEGIIGEIAEKIETLKGITKDNGFEPLVFVQKCAKLGIPAELMNQILGELIKYAPEIDNFWGYAITILNREEGNYQYAKRLEKHYALKEEEKNAPVKGILEKFNISEKGFED